MTSTTEGTFGRLTYLANALGRLEFALEPLAQAAGLVSGTSLAGQTHVGELSALNILAHAQSERLRDLVREVAQQLGWQVATYDIAPIAHESGGQAVTFITGNSMMPPLREFGLSNGVWNLTVDAWEAYAEGIESRLDELRVYMAAPDYDNALYVVDLARFEYASDPEQADSLEQEWRPIPKVP